MPHLFPYKINHCRKSPISIEMYSLKWVLIHISKTILLFFPNWPIYIKTISHNIWLKGEFYSNRSVKIKSIPTRLLIFQDKNSTIYTEHRHVDILYVFSFFDSENILFNCYYIISSAFVYYVTMPIIIRMILFDIYCQCLNQTSKKNCWPAHPLESGVVKNEQVTVNKNIYFSCLYCFFFFIIFRCSHVLPHSTEVFSVYYLLNWWKICGSFLTFPSESNA